MERAARELIEQIARETDNQKVVEQVDTLLHWIGHPLPRAVDAKFRAAQNALAQSVCRRCRKQYDSRKARGDYTGYCSARCQHEMARALGYRKGGRESEYTVLSRAGQVGDVKPATGVK